MAYTPGQFVFISFISGNISSEAHPFSLASSKPDEIKIIIKNLGDYTASVQKLTAGTPAKIEGPYGNFSYTDYYLKRQIWIAGGIGITPFIGMSQALAVSQSAVCVDLYYCAKTEEELVLFDELKNNAANYPGLTVIPFCGNKDGRLNAKIITERSAGWHTADFLLCGPPVMMKSLRKQLVENGISDSRIHSEEFNF